MKKSLLVFIFLTFLPAASAWAVKVASLYQAEIPVASQSQDERAQAMKEGLVQVLIKVSGNADIEKNAIIKSSLQRADYYVQEYSYALPSSTSSQYLLQVHFNTKDINQLLKRAGLAHWKESRPLTLVWLAVTDPQHSAMIIDYETPGDVLEDMKQQGKKYGLPLIFPMMDMSDVNRVTPADVSAMDVSTLKEAGKRYSPDALLIGNLEQSETGAKSQWQLVLGEDQWNWTITGKTSHDMIAELFNQISQTLAKRYVVKSANASQRWVKLEISNVNRRNDLSQLMQYLKQLTPVQQVQLSQVSGDRVELSVLITGSLSAFQQNASIGQRLILKEQDETDSKLIYEWLH
ncbi:DUF2066 domain-containing protein [Aquicella lusitana]|uniref:DUF2066 domain-containing protein n=1 Tax=Aquicella lusitana TaxID=254246 RepID=A0A370G7T1_9COXI|nr:DUF2066 domain-containing protein [Aquicella lusitana]RDI39848.1 hypothetical protein C8D86_12620 [Aquicella lusitana]VVC73131.1 hypothetical protein AQULUS_08620 [Aquicella lusitana]